jgi:hypothetical protein
MVYAFAACVLVFVEREVLCRGLTPDGSPLLMRDTGSQEVYALWTSSCLSFGKSLPSNTYRLEISAESEVASAVRTFDSSSHKCAETVPLASNSYTLNSLFSIELSKCFRAGLVICKWLTCRPYYTLQAPHIG